MSSNSGRPRPLAIGAELEPGLCVRRLVASGGMGDVYEADDATLGRRVAIKVLRRSDAADATSPTLRAIREGRATARVVHPSVVAVYRVGRWGDAPFLVMEWVEGPTLRAVLAKGPPASETALRWLAEIAAAIDCAHAKDVIHCDLKPENVLLADDGHGGLRARVVDFGLARGHALPQRSERLRHGTWAYLPPEGADAAPTPALDHFALAIIACELLTGARPKRAAQGPEPPAEASAALQSTLRAAWSQDPQLRPPTGAALWQALRAAVPSPSQASMPAEAIALASDLVTVALHTPPAASAARAAQETPPSPARSLIDARSQAALQALELEADGLAADRWGREALVSLWLEARHPAAAAEVLLRALPTVAAIRTQDRLLLRADALLQAAEAPALRLPWLLLRARLCAAAGWLDAARDALMLCRDVAVDLGHAVASPPALAMRRLDVELRLLEGDRAGALPKLRVIAEQASEAAAQARTAGDAATAHEAEEQSLCAAADACALHLQRGSLEPAQVAAAADELRALAEAIGRLAAGGASVAGAALAAQARLERALALQRRAAGDMRAAAQALRRAVACELERGDALAAADGLLLRAELALDTLADARAVDEPLDEAEALIRPLGRVRASGQLDALRGRQRLRAGDPYAAQRLAAVALSTAEALGVGPDIARACAVGAEAADLLGDSAGAWQARQTAARWQRSGRRARERAEDMDPR